ncbi:hypothetical protein BV25DRAFT_1838902 [Artomyces pyxidatus]|uniref:Uncharacterized protein n=1 Tax=Artomyces pyxidatus TaxID=48021 RepID=A0ACB8T0R8_9AGAM|nr:hypothetical protein BV25DRAFT_1838902 [Artomyces pyxidatus]
MRISAPLAELSQWPNEHVRASLVLSSAVNHGAPRMPYARKKVLRALLNIATKRQRVIELVPGLARQRGLDPESAVQDLVDGREQAREVRESEPHRSPTTSQKQGPRAPPRSTRGYGREIASGLLVLFEGPALLGRSSCQQERYLARATLAKLADLSGGSRDTRTYPFVRLQVRMVTREALSQHQGRRRLIPGHNGAFERHRSTRVKTGKSWSEQTVHDEEWELTSARCLRSGHYPPESRVLVYPSPC